MVLWQMFSSNPTRAVFRRVWPYIQLPSPRDRVATAAETVTALLLLWIVYCLAKQRRHLSDIDCIVVVRPLVDWARKR